MAIGKRHLDTGNKDKAIKFLEKSISMFPTMEAKQMLARAKNLGKAPEPQPARTKASAEGVRRRAAQRTEAPKDQRPYTKEQMELVNQCRRCKDLYKMLGVPKDANDATIKKAYRKMAIKLHPDKNSAPGADEAFKEINRAFSILSDSRKRMEYDHYGETSDNPAQGFSRRYQQQEFDPADIFREVFGAGFMNGGNVRTYHFGGGQGGFRQAQRGQAQGGQAQQGGLLQLLPLLLLFFLSFVSLPSGPSEVFSFHQTQQFRVQRRTISKNVIPDIPYYVETSFSRKYARDYSELRRLELQIQGKYVTYIERKCTNDKLSMRQRQRRAKGNVADFDTSRIPSCVEYQRIRQYMQ